MVFWCCTSVEPTSCGRWKSSLEIPLAHIAEIRADPGVSAGLVARAKDARH